MRESAMPLASIQITVERMVSLATLSCGLKLFGGLYEGRCILKVWSSAGI
jgi:hypothetical protein